MVAVHFSFPIRHAVANPRIGHHNPEPSHQKKDELREEFQGDSKSDRDLKLALERHKDDFNIIQSTTAPSGEIKAARARLKTMVAKLADLPEEEVGISVTHRDGQTSIEFQRSEGRLLLELSLKKASSSEPDATPGLPKISFLDLRCKPYKIEELLRIYNSQALRSSETSGFHKSLETDGTLSKLPDVYETLRKDRDLRRAIKAEDEKSLVEAAAWITRGLDATNRPVSFDNIKAQWEEIEALRKGSFNTPLFSDRAVLFVANNQTFLDFHLDSKIEVKGYRELTAEYGQSMWLPLPLKASLERITRDSTSLKVLMPGVDSERALTGVLLTHQKTLDRWAIPDGEAGAVTGSEVDSLKKDLRSLLNLDPDEKLTVAFHLFPSSEGKRAHFRVIRSGGVKILDAIVHPAAETTYRLKERVFALDYKAPEERTHAQVARGLEGVLANHKPIMDRWALPLGHTNEPSKEEIDLVKKDVRAVLGLPPETAITITYHPGMLKRDGTPFIKFEILSGGDAIFKAEAEFKHVSPFTVERFLHRPSVAEKPEVTPQRVLETIRTTPPGKNGFVFMYNGHGSPDGIHLTQGEIKAGVVSADSVTTISAKQFADAIKSRVAKFGAEACAKDIYVSGGCFSQNFMREVIKELGDCAAPPTLIGSSEFGQVASMVFGGGILKTPEGSQFWGTFLRSQSGGKRLFGEMVDEMRKHELLNHSNPFIFVPEKAKDGKVRYHQISSAPASSDRDADLRRPSYTTV